MDYSFGNWVRRRRKSLDLTQQELAARVGCSASAIIKIESDERRPSRQIAELLAQHLEIPPDQRDLFMKVARQEKTPELLGEPSLSDQPSPHPAPHIPLSPTSLVGREFELAEINRLVRDPQCRLLTLTGQGGIGKTHLAMHLAASFDDPASKTQVAFVSLAPVKGREQTVTAIADALGIVLYTASERADQLTTYLHDKDLLLILDNFEHLAADAACTDLIGGILRACHNVKVMTTSRHPLQLQAEWVFEVQGLPIPKSNDPDELKKNSAVTLFVERANQTTVGFKPSNDDLLAIAEICGLVEGLPLGIELAAAWVRTLSCREIAAEIRRSLDFLATPGRSLPERHRSLRATIEYSWKLLSEEEQQVLQRLSIFRGGFSRHAAEQVAGAALPILSALVSKSLLRRVEAGRYDLHELIHQFARERLLDNAPAYRQLQAKYNQYYADLLDRRGPMLKGADRPTAMDDLILDLANLRQAWHWAAAHQQARELSRSADTLFWLYESRSNCREGIPLFNEAVEGLQSNIETHASADSSAQRLALAQALSYKGYFLFRQGQHPQARDVLKTSLNILEAMPLRDSEWQMAVSNTTAFLGTVISVMGEFAEGDRLLHEALKMKKDLGDHWGSAFCLRHIGLSAYHYQGDYDKAYDALEQSLAISNETGNAWSIAASLSLLGIVAYARRDYHRAREHLSQALELSRALEDRASIAAALDSLGLVETAQGQYDEALRLLQEGIALWKEIGEQGSLSQTLNHLGGVFLKTGDRAGARKHFREALSIASSMQTMPVLFESLVGEAEIRIAEGALESALEILTAIGQHPASSFATKTHAETLRSELEPQLSAPRIEAVKNQAAGKPTEMLVHEILSAHP
ncbi:MAG: hypothetical protein DPW18_10905 [Chloroflexi bacterium]|nr:hypothetical protein [Chloroflexota bacterium]MDL1944183.1 tetratricopeptide repeat protein [Chloroflexi bacterium CFX2]